MRDKHVDVQDSPSDVLVSDGSVGYVQRVMLWLGVALGVSALVCFGVAPFIPKSTLGVTVAVLSVLLLVLMAGSIFLVRSRVLGWLSPVMLVLYSVVAGVDAYFIVLGVSASVVYAKLVVLALAVAGVLFVGMGVFGWLTSVDLLRFGWVLFFAVLLVGVVGFVNAVFLHLPVLGVIVSLVGVLVFSGYVAYDFQVLRRGGLGLPASMMALSLFIDFFLLFRHVLEVLKFFADMVFDF